MKRRTFLKGSAALVSSIAATWPLRSEERKKAAGKFSFGVITDVHKDVIHDADGRLRSFVEHMKEERVDFIVQLGDFAVPKNSNDGFLEIWNSFPGPRYHVLGNHDTDGGYSRKQVVAKWGIPDRYYSFDRNGFHFRRSRWKRPPRMVTAPVIRATLKGTSSIGLRKTWRRRTCVSSSSCTRASRTNPAL